MSGWASALCALLAAGPAAGPETVVVGPAPFTPIFVAPRRVGTPPIPEVVTVPAFRLDVTPVTNAQFLAFVTTEPRWQRGVVKAIFADEGYLSHWQGPLELGPHALADGPVTRVSWYAAKAYCAARGARLPTALEWDMVAAAEPLSNDRFRAWYARPTPEALPPVGRGAPNRWGVRDLIGLVWEWVWDFNGALVTGDDRERDGADREAFCGAGAAAARTPSDWAAFMRVGFRAALEARFTVRSLGFRCAYDLPAAPR